MTNLDFFSSFLVQMTICSPCLIRIRGSPPGQQPPAGESEDKNQSWLSTRYITPVKFYHPGCHQNVGSGLNKCPGTGRVRGTPALRPGEVYKVNLRVLGPLCSPFSNTQQRSHNEVLCKFKFNKVFSFSIKE